MTKVLIYIQKTNFRQVVFKYRTDLEIPFNIAKINLFFAKQNKIYITNKLGIPNV